MPKDMMEYAVDTFDPTLRTRGRFEEEPRILVIEDDLDLMNVVTRMVNLIDPSVAVDWTTTVDDAINRLERRRYRLVLADYFLKGSKPGLTLIDSCKSTQPDATFAMMSSLSFDELWELSASSGFPFLRKPFTADECLGFIGSTLA